MDNVISFTIKELLAFIVSVGGVCAALTAISVLALKIINKVRAPEKAQDERIERLEKENKTLFEALEAEKLERKEDIKSLNDRLRSGDDRFNDQNTAIRIILKSLQALLKYSLNGDDVGALNKAEEELNNYLVDK